MPNNSPHNTHNARQTGLSLVEVMVSLVIFSVAILGLIALQAISIDASGDSRSRLEATFYTNEILAQMWGDDRANLTPYTHYPITTGAATDCNFAGSASTYASVTNWQTRLNSSSRQLSGTPGGGGTNDVPTQIVVSPNTPAAGSTQIAITICWKPPQSTTWHRHTVLANINNS